MQLRVELPDKQVTKFRRALKALGETEAPFLQDAMREAGEIVTQEIARRAPGSMSGVVNFGGVKGSAGAVRALGTVTHPGAKSMEFGRQRYYRGFSGNNRGASRRQRGGMKSGTVFKANPGQRAKPFIGIVNGDQAMAAAQPQIIPIITRAIELEWDRLGGE